VSHCTARLSQWRPDYTDLSVTKQWTFTSALSRNWMLALAAAGSMLGEELFTCDSVDGIVSTDPSHFYLALVDDDDIEDLHGVEAEGGVDAVHREPA
jgi:hypothetical protein